MSKGHNLSRRIYLRVTGEQLVRWKGMVHTARNLRRRMGNLHRQVASVACEACPVSTGGGTRLVQLVRGEGRGLSCTGKLPKERDGAPLHCAVRVRGYKALVCTCTTSVPEGSSTSRPCGSVSSALVVAGGSCLRREGCASRAGRRSSQCIATSSEPAPQAPARCTPPPPLSY
jgi:hypothetical protein